MHGDSSKINACLIKENTIAETSGPETEKASEMFESILSTRLPDESFRGLINFVKAHRPYAPITEIEKALVSFLKS